MSNIKEPPGRNDVIKHVEILWETEKSILRNVRKSISESVDIFVNNDIGQLFQLAVAYNKCFTSLGIKTKHELEKLVKGFFRHTDIQECFEQWQDYEREWDDILKDIDSKFSKGNGRMIIEENDEGPINIPLVNDDILRAKSKVILISFGLKEGAVKWLEDTKCPFDMFLDQDREVYQAFGLSRSVFKVWSISCMVYYAEQMAAGRDLPKPYENVHDDPIQMGGDFIMDNNWKMKLIYCSKVANDRPSDDLILNIIKKSITAEEQI